MKAEALRELGKHAEAMAALQDIDVELGWVADQIRSMAQAGVSVSSACYFGLAKRAGAPDSHHDETKGRTGKPVLLNQANIAAADCFGYD